MSEQRPELRCVVVTPKQAIVTVYELPEPDITYATVLLRMPGGYEARMSSTDAQRLGHALNNAGGGVLERKS